MKKLTVIVSCLLGMFLSPSARSMIGGDHPDLPGFQVLVKEGGRWVEKGTVPFGMRFEEKGIELAHARPDADGQYKIRVSHLPVGMANLDSLTLAAGGAILTPFRIIDVASGEELGRKLSKKDFDVINAQGRTIEARFQAPASRSDIVLYVTGREEDPSFIPGGPCAYPSPRQALSTGTYRYTIGGDRGGLTVDGRLDGDETGRPLFKEWTTPISGHPDGYTYGYLKNDDSYLYGALDFTSDNTYDGLDDFGAVLIKTDEGWKEFQVSAGRERWGLHGFTYTDKVAYQHKVYEFKIPLSEIGEVRVGRKLGVAFLAYGTAACPATVNLLLGDENPAAATVPLGNDSLSVVMLQIDTFDAEANALIDTISITGVGTGNEATDLQAVKIYKEPTPGMDGILDGTDTFIGTGTFGADDGTAVIDLTTGSYNARGVEDSLLVVYEIKASSASGSTFRARLASNSDVSTQSDNPCPPGSISYSGAPIEGNLMTIAYGSTTAAAGAQNPAASDLLGGQTNVPMLQFSLAAGSEESQGLQTVTVTGSGTGGETGIDGVRLWEDTDGNGSVSSGDTELGSSQIFAADDGTVTFNISPSGALAAGGTKNYLVTYDFDASSVAVRSFWRGLVSAVRTRIALLFPWTFPAAVGGCGGATDEGGGGAGDGGGEETVACSGAPTGTQFTDEDGNAVTTVAEGATVQLRTTDGALILEFTAGSDDVSLDGATVARDDDETLVDLPGTGATLVANGAKSAVSGLPETITVLVPCDADDNRVRICPGATELTTTMTACDNSEILLGSTASDGYTFANTDRTGTDDCRVAGAPSAFDDFLGQGVTVATFQASLAVSSNVALTGTSSSRTINPAGLPLSGGEKTVVVP